MGFILKWDITYKCNLHCAHCINGNFLGKTENELSLEEVKNIIRKLKIAGADRVHLLGGEPLARSDIMDIFDCFEEEGLNFGFNTNGLKLTDTKMREAIMQLENLRKIVVSLEVPTAENNEKIRGKKVFEITRKNLFELVNFKKVHNLKNLTLSVNTVVSQFNIEYIIDMITWCQKMGVDEIGLLQFLAEGNGAKIDGTITPEQEVDLVKKIAGMYEDMKGKIKIVPKFTYPLARKYAKEVLHLDFPEYGHYCGAGESFFYMNNSGELYPCDRYMCRMTELCSREKLVLSNENTDFWDIVSQPGFEEVFEKSEGKDAYRKCEPCNQCEYLRKNCYPCPVYAARQKIQVQACRKMMEEIKSVQSK